MNFLTRKKVLTILVVLFLGFGVYLIFTKFHFNLKSLKKSQTIIIEGMVGQPRLINPLYADLNPIDHELSSLVFNGLTKFSTENQFVGDLAEKWEISEDGKEYRLYLKKVYWQDGKEFNSQDVISTYKITQDPNYEGPLKEAFKEIQAEEMGPDQVKFTLSEPFAPFLETLTLGILPQHYLTSKDPKELLRNRFNLFPVGTGIAKLEELETDPADSKKIRSLTFSLKDSQIKKIMFKFYENEEEMITAWKLGEINSFATTSPKISEILSGWKNYTLWKAPLLGNQIVLFFNLRNEKLKNLALRKALAYLIPENKNWGEPCLGPIPSASWAACENCKKYNYNLEEAKNFLSQADLLEPISLTISIPQKHNLLDIAKSIKKSWQDLKIETQIEVLPIEKLQQEIIPQRSFEVLLTNQQLGRDPDLYIFWHSTQIDSPGLNICGLEHQRVDKALEEGRQKINQEERKKAYRSLQVNLAEEVPALFLYHPYLYYVTRKNIKNVDPSNLWYPEDRFQNISQWNIE